MIASASSQISTRRNTLVTGVQTPPASSLHDNEQCRCWCRIHVHVCAVGDNAIVLDLRRDRYLAVPRRAMQTLALVVPGWPTTPCCEPEHLPAPSQLEVQRTIQFYVDGGILTTIASEGKSAEPLRYLPPRELVPLGFALEATRRISWNDARCFIYASTLAAYKWRTSSLYAIVRKVMARKARAMHRKPFDCVLAAELACTYRRLQAFAFTGRNRCLLRSLSFANFLACYGLYPDWVFGVQTHPFAAHCWLQQDNFLLSETPEGVKRFTPIFSA